MLAVEQVTYSYNPSFGHALNEVSMTFDKGGIIGILGANGSGKSTLMKVIMGLYRPQSGRVLYEGAGLSYRKKDLYAYRQDVCIVFQDPEQQLFYALVEDDVGLALKNLGYPAEVIEQRVAEALDAMHIQHLAKRPIQYLSFGQKKKVAIAGAVALKPSYLLLDEPTAGLDPKGRSHMIRLMKKLVQQGTTIILTSHDMDLMYDCCDYTYVLHQGQLILEGEKDTVFLNRDLLEKARLGVPWLVRLHQELGLPLCSSEDEFFERMGNGNGKITHGSRDSF
ncbi:cobalt/nickel transport system ATP-binding protein [Streptococcus rupicaprae]|uniref:ABC transporter ATP-binding protein n=1 Tax=Streptococcus rupicaprae TaxID=759619 RepID=A0ABV2FF16_9STRE